MADENLKPELEAKAPEVNPTESQAREQGWVPKEEWEGPEDKWRPAREFLDRGELFKKIDSQSRELKDMRKALGDLYAHNSKIAEIEYARALNDLKSQKKAALAEGDVDAVVDIDERIDVVKDAQRHAAAQPQRPNTAAIEAELQPVFLQWKERNSWYDSSKAMRVFADQIGKEVANSGMSPQEVLATVEREVRKEFADKFQNPNRAKAPAVEGSSNKGGNSSSKDNYELDDQERRVMQRLIATIPGFSREKYITELKKVKGI